MEEYSDVNWISNYDETKSTNGYLLMVMCLL